ncbi:titin-like isoform X2 [Daphnia pulex]|uniref:titin-like isoform X2 n=1 Tax=Daphnia pulex TaxID=6669 RepID=UPI001EDF10DB|nr:titin-like isoform X2 [Daphnia pulex]
MAEISVKLPKPKYGQIVVLQKNGDEPRGHGFPLTSTTCVVGRCLKSDIRITSADVSDTHCKFLIDEVSGEASVEIHGNETEVNGTHFEAVSLIKLNHKDVVLVGGRKLRFEYLPPDYKPLSNKPVAESTDSFSAEVVDLEENGDVVDSNAEKEEDIAPEVPSTPSLKRVSFGPYLSPEQFDNTLPPATPIKKGATPRRSTRYSGLKFIRAPIDSLIEEEGGLETPADENLVANDKECVDETLEDAEASVSSVTSVDETSILDKTSPSLAEATEFLEISARANLDMSSIDAMSTMSDVSNIAVVPSECCSFLDEPVEEGDFEVVEQEDTSLFDDDLIGAEIPVPEITTPHLTNGTTLLRSFTTSSLVENMGEEEEEGITLSPEDMSEGINGHTSTVESAAQLEEAEKESVPVESNSVPLSPQADYTDVRGVKQLLQTPKPVPATPKADYTDVEGVEQLLKTPKNAVTSPHSPKVNNSDVEKTPKPVALEVNDDLPKDVVPALEPVAKVEAVCSVSVEKLIETPESSPQMKSPEIANSPPADSKVLENVGELSKTLGAEAPETSKVDESVLEDVDRLHQTPKTPSDDSKLNCTDLEGVARLLETPKTTRSVVVAAAGVGKTPEADYTDVRGIKKLLQTPKPPPNTPKADYRDVRGVKRLLATPKATPGTPKADYTDVEGVDLLMKTPKAKDHVKESDEKEVPEKILEESTPEAPIEIANATEDIVDAKVDEGQSLTSEKEEIPLEEDEVETKVTEPRRGQRVSRTPKTPNVPSKRTASPSEPEEQKDESSVVEKKSCPSDELAEVTSVDDSEVSAKIPSEIEQQVEEEESVAASAPKRGRRAAASKTNTPKADYRDVSGVKRLLKTPKADYSDVDGVELLMKTPKAKDPVPQIEEEEKNLAVVEEEVPAKVVVETASEADQQSSETAEEPVGDVVESVEQVAATAPQMDMAQPVVEEEPVEKETNPPKRGRRAAAAKVNTPKADYRNVSGVKRLLRTPKAGPGTPKADYSDVEGVDLLMKTPKSKDPVPQSEEEEKNVAIVEEEEEAVPEKLVVESTLEAQTSEPIEEPVSDVVDVASQMKEEKPIVEEEMKEEEPEAPLPKRGRRAASAKKSTPKFDYRDVKAIEKLLKTSAAARDTPKVHCTDVKVVEQLTKTPQSKNVESESEVAEESSKNPVEKTTTEAAPVDKTETTDELANEEEQTKESEAEKDVIPARRSRRAVPTPKTNTPKPASRSKRKPPQSEPEIQPEVSDTVEVPLLPATEKEEPAVVEEASSEETSHKAEEEEVPVKSVITPKRGRRAAAVPASKVETPKATRSTRVKKQSESDSVQAEAETRPVRSRRRKDDLFNDEKLSLSPVVRLCQIEVPQTRVSTSSDEMDKEVNKRVSSSSNDEVAPAKRGRGRPKLIKKAVPKKGKAVEAPVPDVVEPVASADEMEQVEVKPAKKTTRRATSKQTVEKVEGAPEEKRRRGGSKPAAGLDDVEMLHEGKGHAADIHANHMPDDLLQETNEESTATTSSGRPIRSRKATLKVHFDVAGAAASPVRSTRSTRKTTAATAASSPPDKTVSILLERDPDIDTLAAVGPANEDEEKVPTSTATKRPRQKKVPAAAAVVAEEKEDTESPAAPAVKRTRGGKKVSTDSDVPKVESSSPPPAAPSPRRTRRTRNI